MSDEFGPVTYHVDWSKVVAMKKCDEVPSTHQRQGAYLYTEGGHVLYVLGQWEFLQKRFDAARTTKVTIE